MEKLKLNSKKGHTRSRVISGHGPHRIMEMKQQEALEKLAKKELTEPVVSK